MIYTNELRQINFSLDDFSRLIWDYFMIAIKTLCIKSEKNDKTSVQENKNKLSGIK